MIERLTGKVNKVQFIKNVGSSLDLCEITIGFDCLKIFYTVADLMLYLDKDVYYTVRQDMIDGRIETVVCELAELYTIQTVESIDNVKLIPEGNKRTICNFNSREVRYGEYYSGRVAFLASFAPGSSRKSTWYDLTLIDAESKEFSMKYFTSKDDMEHMAQVLQEYVGHYVTFDLRSTRYGFQVEQNEVLYLLPNAVELSPEVEVAKKVVLDTIAKDEALMAYDATHHLVDTLVSRIDGEPGYMLVRMASEIYMINAIDNISTDLDIRAMKRAVICSRGYCLGGKRKWSRPLLNTNKCMKIVPLKEDTELMLMLDVFAEEDRSETNKTYVKIRGLVNDIISIRRGTNETINGNDTFVKLYSEFNGLL